MSAAMKVYHGERLDGETVVQVMIDDQAGGLTRYLLDWRLDIANHSPTGLEWGYGGSGPAQLAIAILADHFNVPKTAPKGWDGWVDTPAARLVRRVYRLSQPFKWKAIATLDRDADVVWDLDARDVDRIVSEIEQEQAASIVRPTIGGGA